MDAAGLAWMGWTEMIERSWPGLVSVGLPPQLARLADELGRHRGRPVRVFTMPMLEAGVAGLALPFVDDDRILLDPSLTCREPMLGEVVAHELAYLLHPNWEDLAGDNEEIEQFASELPPMLLAKSPDYPMIDVAFMTSRQRAMRSAVDHRAGRCGNFAQVSSYGQRHEPMCPPRPPVA